MNRSAQICVLACTLFAFSQVIFAQQMITDDVTARLVPPGFEPENDEKKVYQLKGDMWVTIYIENRTKQRLRANVVDPHYTNRLQLYKDNVLIPYREEITNTIRLQDENLKQVTIERDRFIEAEAIQGWANIGLYDWYGPLLPGIYRVTIRHRFEIGGPWTREGVSMLFEVPEIKINAPITPPPDAPKLIRKKKPKGNFFK